MIAKTEILAELENTPEPEKKLHEIADREGLPVMVIRKFLRDLVKIEPPEPEAKEVPAHYKTGQKTDPEKAKHGHRWTEEELRYMSDCWERGASCNEIASIIGVPCSTVSGVVQRYRSLFPPKVRKP